MSLLRLALEGINHKRHNVYVVELSKEVLSIKKFTDKNPNYIKGKMCLYVGATGLTPEDRFKKHKDGIKANTYVTKYGLRLVPSLYEKHNPMTHDDAYAFEKELTAELRNKGYCVWSA